MKEKPNKEFFDMENGKNREIHNGRHKLNCFLRSDKVM